MGFDCPVQKIVVISQTLPQSDPTPTASLTRGIQNQETRLVVSPHFRMAPSSHFYLSPTHQTKIRETDRDERFFPEATHGPFPNASF